MDHVPHRCGSRSASMRNKSGLYWWKIATIGGLFTTKNIDFFASCKNVPWIQSCIVPGVALGVFTNPVSVID